MADLAKLVARLELQSSQFQAELEKTNQKLLGFQRKATESLSEIEKSISEFGRSALEFAGVGLSFEKLAGSFEHAIERGDELVKLSDRMHTTVESLTQLQYAAKLSDISFESLSGSLDIMSKNIGMAADGTGRAQKILELLNLSAKDLVKLPLDNQLGLIADKIAGLGSSTEQTQVAMQIFGGEGAKLVPILNKGAAGIEELRKQADALGVTLSTETAKSLAESADSVKKLSAAWEAFSAAISAKAAPAITRLLDGFRMLIHESDIEKVADRINEINYALYKAPKGSGIFQDAQKHSKELNAELDMLYAKLKRLSPSGKNEDIIQRVISPATMKELDDNFKWLDEQAKKSHEKLIDGLEINLDPSLRKQKSQMQEFYDSLDKLTQTSVEKELSTYAEKQVAIRELLNSGVIDEQEAAKRRNEILEEEFKDVEVTQKKIVLAMKDQTRTMTFYWEQAQKNMQTAFADFLYDPFKDGLNGMLKGFVDIVRRMAAEAASAKIFEKLTQNSGSSSGLSGFGSWLASFFGNGSSGSSSSSTITNGGDLTQFGGNMASGGPLEQNKWYMAGEHGPEPIWGGGPGAYAMGYGGGELHVHNNNTFQVTRDVSDQKMLAYAQQISDATISRIKSARRRGKAA